MFVADSGQKLTLKFLVLLKWVVVGGCVVAGGTVSLAPKKTEVW